VTGILKVLEVLEILEVLEVLEVWSGEFGVRSYYDLAIEKIERLLLTTKAPRVQGTPRFPRITHRIYNAYSFGIAPEYPTH